MEKRELIKVSVLKNCIDDPKEIASVIAERTHSNVVKVIGKKMIFYRKAKKNKKTSTIIEFMIATEDIVLPMVKSGTAMSQMILK